MTKSGWQTDCPYCDWESDVQKGEYGPSGKADALHERFVHVEREHRQEKSITWFEDAEPARKVTEEKQQ